MGIKKTVIYLLTAMSGLVCTPTLYTLDAPIEMPPIISTPQEPKSKIVRFLDATRKFPPEIIQSPAFTKIAFRSFSALDYLKYYDALQDIRKQVISVIDTKNESTYADLIEEVNDYKTGQPFKRFKGDNLMNSIQAIAAKRVGKILNCSAAELEDGSCQPLKNSTDSRITSKERAAKPFAQFDKKKSPWTRDWVRLAPLVEMFSGYPDHFTWKIDFLKAINNLSDHRYGLGIEFNLFDYKNAWSQKDSQMMSYSLIFPRGGKPQPQNIVALQRIYFDTLPDFLQEIIIKKIHHSISDSGLELRLSSPVVPQETRDYINYRKKRFIEKLRAEKISVEYYPVPGKGITSLSLYPQPSPKLFWQFWK